jgi:hypothetical protein
MPIGIIVALRMTFVKIHYLSMLGLLYAEAVAYIRLHGKSSYDFGQGQGYPGISC